jgi:hypothetical protein
LLNGSVTAERTNDVHLSGLDVRGGGRKGTGIALSEVRRATVERCRVQGFERGIVFRNCSEATARECRVHDNAGEGILGHNLGR